uniref:Uncharacterized protein n=1 Tax=Glossina pallidipes TaxID=7398 RepID=A0A1A9Z5H9_GLOPL
MTTSSGNYSSYTTDFFLWGLGGSQKSSLHKPMPRTVYWTLKSSDSKAKHLSKVDTIYLVNLKGNETLATGHDDASLLCSQVEENNVPISSSYWVFFSTNVHYL